ncbi:MAG: hypothetical protein ABJA66_10415 [Actinomycetota bacterium]
MCDEKITRLLGFAARQLNGSIYTNSEYQNRPDSVGEFNLPVLQTLKLWFSPAVYPA